MKDKSVKRLRAEKIGSSIAFGIIRWALLLTVGYIIILPFCAMLSYAFMPADQMNDPSVVWIPKSFTFDNFKTALQKLDFWNSLKQTATVQLLSAVVQTFSAAVAAYGMSRFRFKLKGLYTVVLMLTIFIPAPMIIVSQFGNFSNFDVFGIFSFLELITGVDTTPNLINTPLTFYIPAILGVGLRSGLCIFIYMQFFKDLPKELEEAASVDGAGPVKTFLRIIIPSSGVIIFTVLIFSLIWHWNDYYLSVMYYNNNYPLAVMLSQYLKSNSVNITARLSQMAACLLFVTPMLLFYMVVQRKFIQSIDRVGIVG